MALTLTRRRDGVSQPSQHWQPLNELDQLQELTQQLMQDALSGRVNPDAIHTPLVDIEETEDAWLFEAELPGVQQEDINLEVNGTELSVTGEIKERERKGILRRRSRPVGRFEFRVTLPAPVEPGSVDANLKDGVLIVRVPKPETSRPRRIDVQQG
jgi:HSP20 family protein